MDFTIEKVAPSNKKKYSSSVLDISLAFSKDAYAEFSDFLKGIILFGSASRKLHKKEGMTGDIDLLIILDDISLVPKKDFVEAYKIILQKLIVKHSKRIHVTTMKFTSFWDLVRTGDPLVINILRDGVSLVDTGFFDPLQALLLRGQIRPSYESIWTYYNRAPENLNLSRGYLLKATDDLYWAVIDSAHAALMKLGVTPASPKDVSALIQKHLVSKKLCTQTYADSMKLFYNLHKELEHRTLTNITGVEYEKYYSKAEKFVEKMRQIISHH